MTDAEIKAIRERAEKADPLWPHNNLPDRATTIALCAEVERLREAINTVATDVRALAVAYDTKRKDGTVGELINQLYNCAAWIRAIDAVRREGKGE